MKMLKVSDVMTSPVISVEPDTPYKRIAALLAENGISAVPVIDADRHVLGLVSEADLLPRLGHLKPRTGYFLEGDRHRHEAGKATALQARDLMSSPATRLVGDATVAEAARLLYRRELRRLPVVDWNGRLIGIVSRRDLLKSLMRPDAEIEAEVRSHISTPTVEAEVHDGIVVLTGHLPLLTDVEHLEALVSSTAGVVDVRCGIQYDVDDHVVSLPHRLVT